MKIRVMMKLLNKLCLWIFLACHHLMASGKACHGNDLLKENLTIFILLYNTRVLYTGISISISMKIVG